MQLTNSQIYAYTQQLLQEFDTITTQLPIKISFSLVKNKNILMPLATELETMKLTIFEKYGEKTINDDYVISSDKREVAVNELNELFALTQEVPIHTIQLNDFNDTNTLTPAQMEALMFMIEE